mgnify:CR=1 FL=1
MAAFNIKQAVDNGQIDKARNICENLRIISFEEFLEDDLQAKIGLYFLVLSVKKPSQNRPHKPLQLSRGKTIEKYHRLILAR